MQPTHTLICGGGTGTPTCCSIRRSVTRTPLSCPKRAESASWGRRLRTLHCEWTYYYLIVPWIIYHYINVWRNQLFIYIWSILKKDLALRSIPTTVQQPIFSIFPRSAPSSPDVSPQSSPRPPRANNDRLTLLTRLVRKGEKKGLFVEKMPASIYQVKCGQVAQRLQGRKSLHHNICSVGNRGRTLSLNTQSSDLSICVLCRWWEMKIWSSWGTEMSTTATTSTSPFPWPPSMQYVLLLFVIV